MFPNALKYCYLFYYFINKVFNPFKTLYISGLKGIIHPKILILPFFHVVLNFYEFISCVEHKRQYFEEC